MSETCFETGKGTTAYKVPHGVNTWAEAVRITVKEKCGEVADEFIAGCAKEFEKTMTSAGYPNPDAAEIRPAKALYHGEVPWFCSRIPTISKLLLIKCEEFDGDIVYLAPKIKCPEKECVAETKPGSTSEVDQAKINLKTAIDTAEGTEKKEGKEKKEGLIAKLNKVKAPKDAETLGRIVKRAKEISLKENASYEEIKGMLDELTRANNNAWRIYNIRK